MAPSPAQRGWWLEDAVVGATIAHGGGRTIGAAEHVQLAWLTHNVSDIHGNLDTASRGDWGEPLVLGALTAAIVVGLASPAVGTPETAGRAAQAGWSSIRLVGAVRAGDTLSAESRIESVRGADEAGAYVRRTVLGRDQLGGVVAVIEDEVYAPRRPRSTSQSNV